MDLQENVIYFLVAIKYFEVSDMAVGLLPLTRAPHGLGGGDEMIFQTTGKILNFQNSAEMFPITKNITTVAFLGFNLFYHFYNFCDNTK